MLSILNVPVQINRGSQVPTSSMLLEGEPFLNVTTGTLYIRSNSGVDINISGQSYSTQSLQHTSGLFNFNINSSSCSIAGFDITSNNWRATSSSVTVRNMRVSELRTTVLTTEMYGRSFPANPTNGQLFFKLAE